MPGCHKPSVDGIPVGLAGLEPRPVDSTLAVGSVLGDGVGDDCWTVAHGRQNRPALDGGRKNLKTTPTRDTDTEIETPVSPLPRTTYDEKSQSLTVSRENHPVLHT
jgi:hypothetical protein